MGGVRGGQRYTEAKPFRTPHKGPLTGMVIAMYHKDMREAYEAALHRAFMALNSARWAAEQRNDHGAFEDIGQLMAEIERLMSDSADGRRRRNRRLGDPPAAEL